MGRRFLRPVGFAALVGLLAAPLAGQGSSVYNQSACVSARGGAAVAAPCLDASSVYYNPAAIAVLPSAVSAGLTAVYNSGSFIYDTTGVEVERDPAVPIVPQAYATYRFGSQQRFGAGIGVWAPYGLGIEWPRSFEGRFISYKTQLRGIYIQPTLAWQAIPGQLSIAAGPQVVFGGIELNQHIDAPVASDQLAAIGVPLGTDIASANLQGSGTGFGAQFALHLRITEELTFGARYMLPVRVDLEGSADFEQIMNPDLVFVLPDVGTVTLDDLIAQQGLFAEGGPLTDQDAESSLEFPPQAVVGVAFDAMPGLMLSADYQWTGWSTFNELRATFSGGAPELALTLNYNDTRTYRTGITYDLSPTLQARGGFIYNTPASPDETVTPILPEAERQLYTLGLGYETGRLRADVYYNYVNQADRRGRVRSALPPTLIEDDPLDLNVGVYTSTAHLVGLTLSYAFGDAR